MSYMHPLAGLRPCTITALRLRLYASVFLIIPLKLRYHSGRMILSLGSPLDCEISRSIGLIFLPDRFWPCHLTATITACVLPHAARAQNE